MSCRMNFNQAEEEYIDGEDTIGLGTLGKEGSGRCVLCQHFLHVVTDACGHRSSLLVLPATQPSACG